VNFLLCITR